MSEEWIGALDPAAQVVARSAEMLAATSSVEEFDHAFEVTSRAIARTLAEHRSPQLEGLVERMREAATLDDIADRHADINSVTAALRQSVERGVSAADAGASPLTHDWLAALDPATQGVARAAQQLAVASTVEGFDHLIDVARPLVNTAIDEGPRPAAGYLIRQIKMAMAGFERIEDKTAVIRAALQTVQDATVVGAQDDPGWYKRFAVTAQTSSHSPRDRVRHRPDVGGGGGGFPGYSGDTGDPQPQPQPQPVRRQVRTMVRPDLGGFGD